MSPSCALRPVALGSRSSTRSLSFAHWSLCASALFHKLVNASALVHNPVVAWLAATLVSSPARRRGTKGAKTQGEKKKRRKANLCASVPFNERACVSNLSEHKAGAQFSLDWLSPSTSSSSSSPSSHYRLGKHKRAHTRTRTLAKGDTDGQRQVCACMLRGDFSKKSKSERKL